MLRQIQEMEDIEMYEIFKALANPVALKLFKHITNVGNWSPNGDMYLISSTRQKTGTKKIFYSNILKLRTAGLIKRKLGIYSLTSYGKIISKAQIPMVKACNELHMLKALDLIDKTVMPKEEYEDLVRRLVVDERLRGMLLS